MKKAYIKAFCLVPTTIFPVLLFFHVILGLVAISCCHVKVLSSFGSLEPHLVAEMDLRSSHEIISSGVQH